MSAYTFPQTVHEIAILYLMKYGFPARGSGTNMTTIHPLPRNVYQQAAFPQHDEIWSCQRKISTGWVIAFVSTNRAKCQRFLEEAVIKEDKEIEEGTKTGVCDYQICSVRTNSLLENDQTLVWP